NVSTIRFLLASNSCWLIVILPLPYSLSRSSVGYWYPDRSNLGSYSPNSATRSLAVIAFSSTTFSTLSAGPSGADFCSFGMGSLTTTGVSTVNVISRSLSWWFSPSTFSVVGVCGTSSSSCCPSSSSTASGRGAVLRGTLEIGFSLLVNVSKLSSSSSTSSSVFLDNQVHFKSKL